MHLSDRNSGTTRLQIVDGSLRRCIFVNSGQSITVGQSTVSCSPSLSSVLLRIDSLGRLESTNHGKSGQWCQGVENLAWYGSAKWGCIWDTILTVKNRAIDIFASSPM